jgi:DNA-binding transcriptional ArsR family regulator
VETKSFEFPYTIRNALKGLDNDLRLKIVEYLVENGETSYSKILKGLEIKNKGKLTFHLRKLSESGVIDRLELLGSNTDEKSFYNISPFGRNVVNGLMSSLLPRQTTLMDQNISLVKGTAQTSTNMPLLIPIAPSASQMKYTGRKTDLS